MTLLPTSTAGSLPKPAWLAQPETLWSPWRLDDDILTEGKQDALLLALSDQQHAGIDIVSDGEQSRQHFVSGAEQLYARQKANDRTNTTIGAIVTNGDFNKAELTKIAEMTRCAYARCINPVGTMADGDTIYAATSGKRVKADISTAGTLAAEVMARAIQNAIKSSQITDEEYLRNCR